MSNETDFAGVQPSGPVNAIDFEDDDGSAAGGSPGGRANSRGRRNGTSGREERALTLADAAREYIWLYDQRHGLAVHQIAARAGASVHQVKRGLRRARALEARQSRGELIGPWGRDGEAPQTLRLVPLFPVGALVPNSECPHHGPIEPGSNLCCMVCHQSGLDGHPALERDPKTDPAPEPKPAAASAPTVPARRPGAGAARETRRERRQQRFAS